MVLAAIDLGISRGPFCPQVAVHITMPVINIQRNAIFFYRGNTHRSIAFSMRRGAKTLTFKAFHGACDCLADLFRGGSPEMIARRNRTLKTQYLINVLGDDAVFLAIEFGEGKLV